nr:hypothetical protein [Tanacetum cinerariifolium]
LFTPSTQVYYPSKKDMSWTGLPEFADDIITDYSRPSPSIESNSSDLQNNNSTVSEHGESSESIMSKPMIKFVKAADMQFPPPAQVYSPPKKDLSLTGLPEFVDDYVTDYSRPTPSIDESKCNTRNNFSVFEHGESSGSIMSKPMIKFIKAADCPRGNIDDKGYWDSGCSRHMTVNISYLSEYEPYARGYVSFGQGGGKITGKGIIKTGKLE